MTTTHKNLRSIFIIVLLLIILVSSAPFLYATESDTLSTSSFTADGGLIAKGQGLRNSIKYTWNAYPKASEYELYFAKSGKQSKLVRTTSSCKYTVKKLKSNNVYIAYVKAKDKRGNTLAQSPTIYLYPKKSVKSNATKIETSKTLTIQQGDSAQILSKVTKKSSRKPLLKRLELKSDFRYYSQDENIATVDKNGIVTAVQPGKVYIYTMAVSGVHAKTLVTVNPIPVQSISIPNTLSIYIGEVASIDATILPENATDKSVTWESADTSIATVSNSGVIVGVSEGTSTITATSGNVKASCQVNVYKEPELTTIDTANWMKCLPDTSPISELNIPGTHNTACRYFYTYGNPVLKITSPFAKTQGLSIPEQMEAGIRFMDIRMAIVNEDDEYLTVPHNMCLTTDEKDNGNIMTVDRVIELVEAFLNSHPQEFIVIKFQHDSRTYDDYEENFIKLENKLISRFENEPNKMILGLGDEIPSVGEARGKIIYIANSDIQRYASDNDLKGSVLWENEKTYYDNAVNQNNADTYIFTKGKGTASRPIILSTDATGIEDEEGNSINLGIPDPESNASEYNSRFLNYQLQKGKFYGWFMMDYITKEISTKIIFTNIFSYQNK